MSTNGFLVDIPVVRGGRRKTAPGTGCSMTDWIGMCQSAKKPKLRSFSREEIEMHNRPGDLWMVIQGKVYDCTLFSRYHPGGEGVLLTCAGKDATVMYNKYHPWVQAEAMMGPFCLGVYDAHKKFEAPPPYPGKDSSFAGAKYAVSAPEKKPKQPWSKGQPLTPSIVRGRCTEEELWVIIYGKVYDITSFQTDHPGGREILINNGGRDCTTAFEKYHSRKAKEQLSAYYLGDLKQPPSSLLTPSSTAPPSSFKKASAPAALPIPPAPAAAAAAASLQAPAPSTFGGSGRGPTHRLTLKSKRGVSKDSVWLSFTFPSVAPFTVPVFGHVKLYDPEGNVRSYTPVSTSFARGEVTLDFVVKRYEEGELSRFLYDVEEGTNTVRMAGPRTPPFDFEEASKSGATRYLLVAGGTGIAPFFPFLQRVAEGAAGAGVAARLLLGNHTFDDVLLDVDAIAAQDASVSVVHYLSREGGGGGGQDECVRRSGRIGREALAEATAEFPPKDPATRALVCGPDALNEDVGKFLEELGYDTTVLE